MTQAAAPRSFPPLLDVAAMDDAELRYWARSITRLLWQRTTAISSGPRTAALSDRGRLAAELGRLRAEHERRRATRPD